VHDLLISPSVGGVELVEYVCANPCLTNCFSEEDPDFIPEDVELSRLELCSSNNKCTPRSVP
jgi:hypothetical protein